MRKSIRVLAPLVMLLLSGCITSGKLAPFTDASEEILANAERIHLIKDCFVFDFDVHNHAPYNRQRNQSICTNYLQSIETRLVNRGLGSLEIRAVTGGLQAGPNRYVLDHESPEERINLPVQFSSDHLNQRESYIYASIASELNTMVRNHTERFHFVNYLRNIQFEQLHSLDIPEDELVMMVLTGGLYYPPSESAAVALATLLVSFGTAVSVGYGRTVIRVVVLDGKGRPVWADVAYNKLVYETGEGMDALLTQLLRFFPDVDE